MGKVAPGGTWDTLGCCQKLCGNARILIGNGSVTIATIELVMMDL